MPRYFDNAKMLAYLSKFDDVAGSYYLTQPKDDRGGFSERALGCETGCKSRLSSIYLHQGIPRGKLYFQFFNSSEFAVGPCSQRGLTPRRIVEETGFTHHTYSV